MRWVRRWKHAHRLALLAVLVMLTGLGVAPVYPDGWGLPGSSVGLSPRTAEAAPATRTSRGSLLAVPRMFAFTLYSEEYVALDHGGSGDQVTVIQTLPVRDGFGAIYARYASRRNESAIELDASTSGRVKVIGRLETPQSGDTCGSSGNKSCIKVDTNVNCVTCVRYTGTAAQTLTRPTWDFNYFWIIRMDGQRPRVMPVAALIGRLPGPSGDRSGSTAA